MKVKSILFVYTPMLLIFFELGCIQNSGKNQNGAKDDTIENRLSIGEHFAPVNGITLHYYVVGDDDFICPKTSQADRIVKNISNSTEIVIKNAGHLCWIEQPEQFFSECEKWLEERKLGE